MVELQSLTAPTGNQGFSNFLKSKKASVHLSSQRSIDQIMFPEYNRDGCSVSLLWTGLRNGERKIVHSLKSDCGYAILDFSDGAMVSSKDFLKWTL